jgi:tagatose 1,6-diphosphate aldolase GatY/KbaY
MLTSTKTLLEDARAGGYAVGAFNVYNLEGAKAVVVAAESERSPVTLQIHSAALKYGGRALIALCLEAARYATVPASVHLDHSASAKDIHDAVDAGIFSIMADGSELDFNENIAFTAEMAEYVHQHDGTVEAELGRLAGIEDDLTTPDALASLTNPVQAVDFVAATGVDALAVCIGNVHGKYPSEPQLDFDRLESIRDSVDIPLVLHGTSGLPDWMVTRCIELGVCKFNVNTEVRRAYTEALRERIAAKPQGDIVDLMDSAVRAMSEIVAEKLRFFGSSGRA